MSLVLIAGVAHLEACEAQGVGWKLTDIKPRTNPVPHLWLSIADTSIEWDTSFFFFPFFPFLIGIH